MVYCFLANGFEEVEAIAPVDMLRRAGAQVKTVGVTGRTVTGSHGIEIVADCLVDEIALDDDLEAIILPGGLPGATNLENNEIVQKAIDFAYNNDKYICAICAAPFILGHKGILENKCAIVYPGFEKELFGAKISSEHIAVDGKFITGKGPGVAIEFGIEIVKALLGEEKSSTVYGALQAK